ncbi:hypothetical protein niasHT_039513 [Heterodera trifolii]|uniref:Integrase catalytic domain-containing protein n=1 Tax=Heterodera trifolii TaxID=157864 RepID=A0ABD2J1D0_9BILA
MASKFVLVPDEIYRGLTNSDSGDINLDFVQRALQRTKRKRENLTAKNVHYNQELSRYLHLRDEQQNKPAKVEITKGLKALIKRGNESDHDDDQIINLEPERPKPPASLSRQRQRRHHHHYNDEEMPPVPSSPTPQAGNRAQKRKANELYSSWEEGAKRQLIHQDEQQSSSTIGRKSLKRRQPSVRQRREQQIPPEIQQEEPFQPAPQPSIPIHPSQTTTTTTNRKRKTQHNTEEIQGAKRSLIDLEGLRLPSPQREASLRFKQKRTNKQRITQSKSSSSSALATRIYPPQRDFMAEAAAAPLPGDDDAENFEPPQQPRASAQVRPLPPAPPLPSKTKKRKSKKDEEDTERKRVKISSRKRDLLAEAAAAPLPDDDGVEIFEPPQQPGTSVQIRPLSPGPPLPSKTKKRKSKKDEEDNERKRIRIGSRKRMSSPTVPKNQPKRQKNSGTERQSEEQRRQYAEDQHLFTIPNSQLTNEQKRRRLQFVFNRNPVKYGVREDTILNNAGNPVTDSSVTQALEYIIERRAGRNMDSPTGTTEGSQAEIATNRPRGGIKPQITKNQRNSTAERQSTGRTDASVSNERSQAENNGPTRSNNGNTPENPTSKTTEMEKSIENVLERLYNDPKSPAAFAGVDRLWLEAKKELGNKIRKNDVKHYLEGHRTYTLMRPRRINFPRARTTAAGFMTDCQVDLADFQSLSRHNSGNRYLMVVIDVLSKRIFVTPLRTKKADDMVEGFKRVFSKMPMKPHRIFSDKGTEFKNQQLKKLFDEEEVEKYESTHSEKKAALAERAIRQIKNRVYRYFAQLKTLNWVNVIDKIVSGINNSPSRVHGMRPIDVNFKNSQKVWERMFGADQHRALFGKHRKRPKFMPGQTVRMSIAKGQFEKGYIPNYGDEILEIDAVKHHMKPMRYKLHDAKGEKFKGFFYPEELAPVRKEAETTYRIERVFRKRKRADGTMENHAESLETIIKNGSSIPIRRKRAASQPQSPPSARVPTSPPSAASNVTFNLKVPTSPPRAGQKSQQSTEEIGESLTNVTKPPAEKQLKIEKQPEVVKPKTKETNTTQNISQPTNPNKNVPNQSDSQNIVSTPSASSSPFNATKKEEGVKSAIVSTPSVPVSNISGQQKFIPPPPISTPSTNVTRKQEEPKVSSEPTHPVLKPPPSLPVSKPTTVSQAQQIVAAPPAQRNDTKPISSSSALNKKEISPPPKQRSENSTVEKVPDAPTHSNVTQKKATSPPRAILTEQIGPPPKQRTEKSLNSKKGQTLLSNEISPENDKKTTITTTTTTTTITEPPKVLVSELAGRIDESTERNNAEHLLSVLFGDEEWKKVNFRILKQIIEGVELQYHPNFERFKAVFTHPRIEFISFSSQLGYVLGFENSQNVRNNEIAKYGSDLRGGFASFAVYAKGLTENMIVGNSLSSLLRVVSVSGAVPGEYTEKIYDSPLYARVLPKEASEIEIELRTMTDGRLVPFSYGTVLIVLIFKKVINF